MESDFDQSTSFNSEETLEKERELIARAATDPVALTELYRMHVERVDRYVRRRLGTNQDAEDIVANVFMSMVKHIHRFANQDRPLMAWLYRVATNEMNRNLRRRRLLKFFHLVEDVPETPRDSHCDAEMVRLLLQRLPVSYQSVLTLHYLEQLSVAEIREVLDLSEATIKTRLCRGRKTLSQGTDSNSTERKRRFNQD